MKVLLVSANTAETPYPVYPLGMSMVASALVSAGHEVLQSDVLEHGGDCTRIADLARREQPGLIGISIRNIDNVNLVHEQRYLDMARNLVKNLRGVSRAPIVLGGAGFSLMPEAVLSSLGADYGIVGEGEQLMVEFTNHATRNRFPEQRILRAPAVLEDGDIPPALYDAPLLRFYLKSGKTAPVQTKRGCDHRCAYCSYPLLEGRRIRCRNPEAIADDVERLAGACGVETVFFADSVFNDDEGRYLELLHTLKRRGLFVPWVAFFKPERFDEATVRLMKETGLRAVELGSDASTDTTLRALCKTFTWADVTACNDLLTGQGVAVAHYFMFGGPGETPDTVREGIDHIVQLQHAVSFIFMGIRILPGTPLEAAAVREGVIGPQQDLLDPVYYLAPGMDREWLENTLAEGFKNYRRCVFPPDNLETQVRLLHQLGYGGVLWDLLAPQGGETRARRNGKH